MDRHARKNPNKVALIWEKDEPGQEVRVTYQELQDMASQIGNLLLDQGIKKGDIVAIYMPVSPLAVASMLACSRIGATHSVIFAGFSSKAIASRVQDMQATAIITANEGKLSRFLPETNKMNSLYQIRTKMLHGTKVIVYIL